MKTQPDLILIANATHARLLSRERGKPMALLQSFDHPQSRAKAADLADAPAGRGRADRSSSGASYPPRTDAKSKEHLRFARELADALEQLAQQGSHGALALFASSQFLGALKAQLGGATQRILHSTHDLDLTSVGIVELESRVKQALALR
jgi:protein required for attachment to host cells